ncbi:MAG: 30S ribosome-binding factor RbfA [Clostridia bacterium]|nr:30S ribosome-binding factor RbfA [Clostridia bacterium]
MSNRIEKVNSVLQRYISDIINNDINDPRIKGIISVSTVSTTPDLKYAKVFLSIFSTENSKDILEAIKSASGYIRKSLASKIEFRCVPSLDFELDTSAEYSQKINDIINSLKDDDNKN